MKLTLIRHTAPDVAPGCFYGKTDVALKKTFEEEAARVKSGIHDKYFDRSFSSPRSRCLRLAEYCGYGDAIIDEDLAEMDFGDWEMKRYADINDKYLEEYFNDWKHTAPPGGESFINHSERMKQFINRCLEMGVKSGIAFTHGGSILHAMILANKITDERPFDHTPPFGGIVTLEFNEKIP